MKNRFRRLKTIFSLFAALFVWALPVQASKIRVVTTLTDLADFAREVGRDHVDVHSLATGIEDTHGVPMKPSFVPLLNRADLVVLVGFDCEHAFLPALLEASKNPRIQDGHQGYVDCAKNIVPDGRAQDHRSLRRRCASLRKSALHARSGPGKNGSYGNLRGPCRHSIQRIKRTSRATATHTCRARCQDRRVEGYDEAASGPAVRVVSRALALFCRTFRLAVCRHDRTEARHRPDARGISRS